MNSVSLHDTIVSTWNVLNDAIVVGIFVSLAAIVLVLLLRELGSGHRLRLL